MDLSIIVVFALVIVDLSAAQNGGGFLGQILGLGNGSNPLEGIIPSGGSSNSNPLAGVAENLFKNFGGGNIGNIFNGGSSGNSGGGVISSLLKPETFLRGLTPGGSSGGSDAGGILGSLVNFGRGQPPPQTPPPFIGEVLPRGGNSGSSSGGSSQGGLFGNLGSIISGISAGRGRPPPPPPPSIFPTSSGNRGNFGGSGRGRGEIDEIPPLPPLPPPLPPLPRARAAVNRNVQRVSTKRRVPSIRSFNRRFTRN